MSVKSQLALAKLFDEGARSDPYPLLTKLRESSPTVMPSVQTVIVGHHADVSGVLRNRSVSSVRPESPSFFSLDPPEHTRLRGLTGAAFNAGVVTGLEPRVRELTHELLDEVAGEPDFDLVQQLGYRLTGRIICELFGLPYEDLDVFDEWSRILTMAIDPQLFPDPAFDAGSRRARLAFEEYFRPIVARVRANPGDDMVSRLVHAEKGGDRMTEQEILETCVLLAVAARENPVGMISNTALALLRHPDQFALVRDGTVSAGNAVEEALRWDTPAQLTGRTALERTTVGGVTVPPGYFVLLLLAAANRDGTVFPDADRFDITRGANNHLAFAAGPHYCMGSDMSRLQARVVLEVLTERMKDPQMVDGSLVYKPNVSIRGPLHLRVAGKIEMARRDVF